MFEVPVLLVLIVVVALIFDFTNGAHDCANAIATVVSTKVLSPRVAVVMAASLNFIGAFLGTKVATTLGAGIVNTDMVANCQPLVLAALLGAIAWNLITWYFGIPSSSSHALIGGLMGAAVAYAGFSTLNGASIAEKILLPLILSPLAGFGMGFLTMFLIMLLCARANRNKLTRAFTKLQIVSAAFMATSHGLNDAQKTMGVITLALFIFNKIDTIAHRCNDSKWFAQMSLPRELSVKNGRLYQTPIKELDAMRKDRVEYNNVVINNDTISLDKIEGRTIDMELVIRPEDKENVYKKFALRFAQNERFHTELCFRPDESVLKIDRTFSGSERALVHQRRCLVNGDANELKLRVILDRFSAEVFINDGEQVMSAVIFTEQEAKGISFFAEGAAKIDVVKYDLV